MPGAASAMLVVILDDESRRSAEMLRCLRDAAPDARVMLFDNAPAIVAWLRDHLAEVTLLSLDHDLGPDRLEGGARFDPGTGRDVTDALADAEPRCPVVVHTSNSLGANSMMTTLELAGWQAHRVVPVNDLAWIPDSWAPLVVSLLRAAGSGGGAGGVPR